jgi:hypothetical protein
MVGMTMYETSCLADDSPLVSCMQQWAKALIVPRSTCGVSERNDWTNGYQRFAFCVPPVILSKKKL